MGDFLALIQTPPTQRSSQRGTRQSTGGSSDLVSELLGPQCLDQHSPTRRRPHPRQAVEEGNARRMEGGGSCTCVGGSDKLGTIMSNQTQSSLACLGTTT